MNDTTFVIKGLQKLKEYFKNNPALQNDIQYMKMLVVTQEKELKRLRVSNKNIRLDLIKALSKIRIRNERKRH